MLQGHGVGRKRQANRGTVKIHSISKMRRRHKELVKFRYRLRMSDAELSKPKFADCHGCYEGGGTLRMTRIEGFAVSLDWLEKATLVAGIGRCSKDGCARMRWMFWRKFQCSGFWLLSQPSIDVPRSIDCNNSSASSYRLNI